MKKRKRRAHTKTDFFYSGSFSIFFVNCFFFALSSAVSQKREKLEVVVDARHVPRVENLLLDVHYES
jgi:hypothetical protein